MPASAMAAQARQLEEEVLQVCEQPPSRETQLVKQRLFNRVGQFLMGSLDSRHWWCTFPTLMTFMMRVIELYSTTDSVRAFFDRASLQLSVCTKCVDVYHASLPSVRVELELEFTDASVRAFFLKISELDVQRIHRVLAQQPSGNAHADRELAGRVSVTLYEVLTQRRLLSDFRILRVLSKWVSSAAANSTENLNLELLEGCSGLFHLLVSPDPGVRAWSTSIVKHIGKIELSGDSGHDQFFMTVLDEWMYVLESALFNQSVLSLNLPSTEGLDLFLDTTNCAKTPTNQILWAALDTVMQQMDETSLETMLESFDNLPDLVFNNLDEADPSTSNQKLILVVAKCYQVLLRCLGHRFWKHTVHSPRVVVALILHHCQLPSWLEYVPKQMIEVLPPLLAAIRPPLTSQHNLDQGKLQFYFDARSQIIRFLIHPDHRPARFQDRVLYNAASRAVLTIIGDCYEHRQTKSSLDTAAAKGKTVKDDGALPESNSIDYSVSDSAFWWPCGPDARQNESGGSLEDLWMNHLYAVVTEPENIATLVDYAALTCVVVLRKHLQLARDALYSCVRTGFNAASATTIRNVTRSKPIITIVLQKLCALNEVTLIPVAVHGALFESIGGIAELLNSVDAQSSASPDAQAFINTLREYETHVRSYFERLCNEVFVKGLINPLRFPVVAQHLSLCLLSPNSYMDQPMKRLLGHVAAPKDPSAKTPSPLEAFLILTHRSTEAFLRSVLSLLQSLRLYDFSLNVSMPILKKIAFNWAKVFELLGVDLKKMIEKAALPSAEAESTLSGVVSGSGSMQRIPALVNDFLVATFTSLYMKKDAESSTIVDEATRIRCLEFGISFWTFWTSQLQDPHSTSKRASGIVAPMTACLDTASAAEKTRAAKLLTIAVDHFVAQRSTSLDEVTLNLIESSQHSLAAIDAESGSSIARKVQKLRQLDKTSSFFGKRESYSAESLFPWEMLRNRKSKATPASRAGRLSNWEYEAAAASRAISSKGPKSAKAAARAQVRGATVDLSGLESVSNSAAARKSHSFYDEPEYMPPQKEGARFASSGDKSARKPFSMDQVVKGMSTAHPGVNRLRPSPTGQQQRKTHEEEEEEEEEEEPDLRYAALFHRIKSTQKPIVACSLLPFYRQLLQVCMPALVSREYEKERSDRVLVAPGLTFKKSSEYVNAFLPLLLEECNNDMQEGLRKCRDGGGHLMRYESEKPREGMRCINFSLVQVDENTRTSMNTKFDKFNRGRGATTMDKLFRNGDTVLLRAATNTSGGRQQSEFLGNREFLGVILVSETEKGKKRTTKKGEENPEEDIVRILFLNDGELDTATNDVSSFSTETLTASAMAESEWRVQPACNLVTSAREYIALRSVDMLPEHLRSTILTPNLHKSTQTDIIAMAEVLDNLRSRKSEEDEATVLKLLKRLDKLEITLTDLRSTSIGKMVNKLRKHSNEKIKTRANALKDKWTSLIDQTDALQRAPRFLSPDLWSAIKGQYNQSQLQSIHNALNNYSVGVSLMQGPPGTGKTKTIMALLSGFLALRPPSSALKPILSAVPAGKTSGGVETPTSRAAVRDGLSSTDVDSNSRSSSAFSLDNVTSAMGSILRRTDSAPATKSTIQILKNAGSVRSRLEHKMSSSSRSGSSSSNLVVRRRVVSSTLSRQAASRVNNLLLCAPSNGAVNELVLRIVTDGLLDDKGEVVKVRAPSVHPEALNQEWLSIVRLGHPGEDAPECVAAVSLPLIIKREMDIHPKNVMLRSLFDNQRRLRTAIRDFHQKVKENAEESGTGGRGNRKELAKMHSELTQTSGQIRRLRDEVSALKGKMTEAILSRASIIACTLSKAGSGSFDGLKRGFDALIIDEAAQAVELSTLVPLRERVGRVVLVGDPKQLPATVKSVVAAKARYDRSLFERIAESGVAPSMLRVQYRMHPFLREFPSKRFYGGMLTDGPSVMERVRSSCPNIYKFTCFQPFVLYDVINSREDEVHGSKYNRAEAEFCVNLCETMYQMCVDMRIKKWTVGFVSPYREQVNALRRELSRSDIQPALSVEVNTVDGFQGREKDVIIFSCVRSSQRGGIGFLRDIRRLNVAITRARFCLFVVGNVNTLVRDETWRALVTSARERQLIIPADSSRFTDVVKRLDNSKEGTELAEHYKQMHEKVNRKTGGDTTTAASDSASATNSDQQGTDKQPESAPTPEKGDSSAKKGELKDARSSDDATKSSSAAISTHPNVPSLSNVGDSKETPPKRQDGEKRLAEVADPNEKSQKVARTSVGRSERRSSNSQDRREPSSPDGGSNHLDQRYHYSERTDQSSRDERQSRDDRRRQSDRPDSGDRRRSENYDRSDKRQRSADRRSRSRDRSRDRSRNGNRSRDGRGYENRIQGEERYGRSNERQQHSGSSNDRRRQSTTTESSKPPPVSITAKEFCMENEPERPKATAQPTKKRPSPLTPRDLSRRHLFTNGAKPPAFASSSSSQPPPQHSARPYDRSTPRSVNDKAGDSRASDHRRVIHAQDANQARRQSGSQGRSSGGGGVLGSILGSASKLANATSRVHDKASARSNEFN